jgi:hypothetical protein
MSLKPVNRFLVKVACFALPLLALHLWALFAANGTTDDFYNKVASPRQQALVLGTSRAQQCVVPAVADSVLAGSSYPIKLFNFAFNLDISPYGKAYLQAIEKKIDPQTKNGLFILCVDPWAVSIERNKTDDDNGQTEYAEGNQYAFLHSVSSQPNAEYLLKKYSNGWGQILVSRYFPRTYSYVHPDGWVEITAAMDSATVAKRTNNRVRIYQEEMPKKYKPSASRMQYLRQTIQLCSRYGKVVLVRLPPSYAVYQVEQQYMPLFDSTMQQLAQQTNSRYLNYGSTGNLYQYTDGNHMYKTSGKAFSRLLATDIIKQ